MTRLRDRVDVIVEAGLRGEAVGEMVWDVSTWDAPTSTWGGIEPTFVALDGWEVLSVSTQRGRAAANRRCPPGTAEVQLGWRSPTGKWSFRATAPVQLGQEMRISCRARDADGAPISDAIPIYRGAVRAIGDGWVPDRLDPSKQTFRVTCRLVDRFADLGAVNLPERPVEGLGDTTDARLERILAMAAIDPYYLIAPPGLVEHASSNFARNLLDEAQVTVESETGDLYVNRGGSIEFRPRLGTGEFEREDFIQLTWANDGGADAIGPLTFGTGQDLDDVHTQISRARVGGTAYTAGGPLTEYALRYGLRTDQRFDMTCRYDADVIHNADFWLAQLQGRTQRIEALTANVDPNMPDARLLQLIDVELRDRQHIRWTDGEKTLQGDVHVQGVAHRITGEVWRVSLNLWAYSDEGLRQVALAWGTARWGEDAWG